MALLRHSADVLLSSSSSGSPPARPRGRKRTLFKSLPPALLVNCICVMVVLVFPNAGAPS